MIKYVDLINVYIIYLFVDAIYKLYSIINYIKCNILYFIIIYIIFHCN